MAQHLDSRSVFPSATFGAGSQRCLPNHVSNPAQRRLHHIHCMIGVQAIVVLARAQADVVQFRDDA